MIHLLRISKSVAIAAGLGAAALLADSQTATNPSPPVTSQQGSGELSPPATPPGRVREVRSASEFDQILGSTSGLILVDFNATWCAPCRLLRPIVDELAATHPTDLTVLSVDVDANIELAQRYGVSSIPALLLCQDGRPIRSQIGLTDRAGLERLVFGR